MSLLARRSPPALGSSAATGPAGIAPWTQQPSRGWQAGGRRLLLGPGPRAARFSLPAPEWGPPLLGSCGGACRTQNAGPQSSLFPRPPGRLTRGAPRLCFPTTSSSSSRPVNH